MRRIWEVDPPTLDIGVTCALFILMLVERALFQFYIICLNSHASVDPEK